MKVRDFPCLDPGLGNFLFDNPKIGHHLRKGDLELCPVFHDVGIITKIKWNYFIPRILN
jgi:hypothetical protein